MTKNIKGTNIEITNGINRYIDKSLSKIKKFVKNDKEMIVYIEVGKTTNHHKQGEVYKAEFNIGILGSKYYSISQKEDLYSAIDESQKEIIRQILEDKERKQTLYKRGATSVKKMIKGISSRNPFTSK